MFYINVSIFITNYQVLGPLVLQSKTAPRFFDQGPLLYPIDSAVADDYVNRGHSGSTVAMIQTFRDGTDSEEQL